MSAGDVERTTPPSTLLPPPPPNARLIHSLPQNMLPAGSAQNSGQPGCTPAERERHSQLLQAGGDLVDAYRHLHPAASSGTGTDTPGITWRGTAGNSSPMAGRYYGKVCEEGRRGFGM